MTSNSPTEAKTASALRGLLDRLSDSSADRYSTVLAMRTFGRAPIAPEARRETAGTTVPGMTTPGARHWPAT